MKNVNTSQSKHSVGTESISVVLTKVVKQKTHSYFPKSSHPVHDSSKSWLKTALVRVARYKISQIGGTI